MNDQAAPLVLLVDDEVLIHELVEEALLEAGYRVEPAHDGGAALELVERSSEADLKTLVSELAHRGRNGLAIIMSIISQSARKTATAQELADVVNGRPPFASFSMLTGIFERN